jgi:rubrerythrin
LNQGLRSEIKSLGAPEISPEQEAIRKIEDLSIETHGAKTELQAKAVEEIAEAKEELIEAVEAIEALEDSEAEEEAPKNYWNCSNCGRANNLKQVRCPKCGTPKKD